MPIFHKIIFKHIFHKRESLYMLPKGKCICMLKRKFCVASFRFLTIIVLFVFVFFSFTPALKALVSAKISIFFLKIRVKSSFSHPVLEGADVGCLTLWSYFYPTSEVWRWSNPVKISNVPFLLQNLQWNQRMNSHEPCK